MYHHFAGKDALVRAVIDHMRKLVIERERDALGHVSTIAGLRRWRDALVQNNALRHGAYEVSFPLFSGQELAADVAFVRSFLGGGKSTQAPD